MTRIEIGMVSGETLTVDGTVEEVEKLLSDAARSGQSRMAWFHEAGSEQRIAVNPAHVASLKPTGDA